MDLKTLMHSLAPEERTRFAAAVGQSLGHLKNVMYGYKPCRAELAADIERETKRLYGEHQTVNRWDLIPARWHLIWPELVGTDGAPPLPQCGANGHRADAPLMEGFAHS